MAKSASRPESESYICVFSQTSRVSYAGVSLLLCICECVQLLMLHLTYVYCMYHMYIQYIHIYSRLLISQTPSDLLLVDNT